MRDGGKLAVVAFAVVAGCAGPPIDQGHHDDNERPDAGTSSSADAAPDALAAMQDPTQPGPWKAGVRTVEVTDASRNRSFKIDVWYPIAPTSTAGTKNTYKLESLFGSLASIDSPARRDAPPEPGAWPLVLFSHGYGGVRFQSYFLTERLATHGFVVVAPDHPGNTLTDFAALGDDNAATQSAMDRPLDMQVALERAIAGQLGVTVDPDRIAATGHSFGGWTSLELARVDQRIDIAFPMAPGFRNGVTADFVAMLARPLLFIGGSLDDTCEFPENQELPYSLAQHPKYLLEVMGAGHLDFSNLCEVPAAAQLADDGCDPANIDPEIVHARSNAVAVAFALRYLRDDARYDAYLDPSYVSALGNVQYWTTP